MSSQAYTPGLKRKELSLVRKSRILPIPGEVLVKEGEQVTQTQIVARTNILGEPYIIKVAYQLGVDMSELENYMLKKVGDSVKEGEALAFYQAFFGLVKKRSISPVSGIVERISNITGQVIVRASPIPVEVQAYIPGTIIKVIPEEGVVVQTPATFIQGIFGIGGETHGELMMIANTPKEILGEELITKEHSGKILVAGSLVTRNALDKAVKLGIKGIVVGGMKDKDLMDFLGYEIGVAITGQEDCNLTVIITEGFGQMNMSEKTFTLLKKYEGRVACINGATQIRAGVMRPEIIIPHQNISSIQFAQLSEELGFFTEGLKPGTQIRIIRQPYFGALGRVSRLPVELQKVETKSNVRVLEAELEDGRTVIVPRANVETIEE
jgi:hypothetical protein